MAVEKENAVSLVSQYCRDGDVITLSGTQKWYEFWIAFTHWAIRTAQKHLFHDPDFILDRFNPDDDTHTMLYFTKEMISKHVGDHEKIKKIFQNQEDASTFSVDLPRATFVPVSDYAMLDLTVFRYQGKALDETDIEIMLKGALPLIGAGYDIGQLLDIAVGEVAGYPTVKKFNIFDFGRRNKVCSVGVAAVYAYWRHSLEKQGRKYPRLFSSLNPEKWDDEFIEEFKREKNKWSVERTYPANFSSVSHFSPPDFEAVLKMKRGNILFRKETPAEL